MAQSKHEVPFEIERVFVLSDLPPGGERGNHAHRACHEFLIVASGAVTVDLDNTRQQWRYRLTKPFQGVHIAPLTWIVLREFEVGTVCVVLASELYNPAEYIHDYGELFAAIRGTSR